MSRVLASASVGTGLQSEAIGCLGALAALPAVAAGVNLLVPDVPPEVAPLTPWFIAAAVLLGVATAYVYVRARKRAELVDDAGTIVLRVDGQELLRGPFEVLHGYRRLEAGPKLQRTTHLLVGVFVRGRLVCTIAEEWGALLGVPDGWPDTFPQMPATPAPRYTVMAGRMAVELVAASSGQARSVEG